MSERVEKMGIFNICNILFRNKSSVLMAFVKMNNRNVDGI